MPLIYVASVQGATGTMDYIIDTVSAVHPLAPLLSLLKANGKLITLGLPNRPLELPVFPLVLRKLIVTDPETKWHRTSN